MFIPASHPNLPKLRGSCILENGELTLVQGERRFVISSSPEYQAQVASWLVKASAGRADVFDLEAPLLRELMSALGEQGLLEDDSRSAGLSGTGALLLLEDYANELLYKTLYKNVFWQNIQLAAGNGVPNAVIYGFVIENYHFLYRESWFDSPALCYAPSKQAQLLMNEFYGEEFGHDELLLKSLGSIGLSRQDLEDTIPLPETFALCNGLAYWASYDPLFFFTTLGILEGKDVSRDSFLEACERLKFPDSFTGPLRIHSDINLKGAHGVLSRELFRHIPFVANRDIERLKASTALFIDLYDAFYSAVWQNYSATTSLLRRVSEV